MRQFRVAAAAAAALLVLAVLVDEGWSSFLANRAVDDGHPNTV